MNMTMKKIMIYLFALMPLMTQAQCGIENTAFKSGEILEYDLKFNWKLIWFTVGTATMDTKMTKFEGKDAWRSYLITRGNNTLDKYFMMRDTLLSYCNPDLSPLYFRKGAREGSRYYVDEVWYSYPGGKPHLRQRFQNRNGVVTEKTYDSSKCIYDMMSLLLRARSFDVDNMTKGEKIRVPLTSGDKVEDITLIYRGRENFKMKSTGITYKCVVFSFV